MKNNTVVADQIALTMCRNDGGELFVVVCRKHDGTVWTSDTFPLGYAEEFAATERWNDKGHRFASVAVEKVTR